jgi:UDP-N-acetylglucosamine transferase subunit ALG13
VRVFVTVGNAFQPFDRMLQAIDAALLRSPGSWDGVCQFGSCISRPQGLRCVSLLTREDFAEEMDRADVVVSHAGVGSVHTAIRFGHKPIVFARRVRLGEHVNDHQVELLEAFAERALVLPASDDVSLSHHLAAFQHGTIRRSTPRQGAAESTLRVIAPALRPAAHGANGARLFIARLLAALGPPIAALSAAPSHPAGSDGRRA